MTKDPRRYRIRYYVGDDSNKQIHYRYYSALSEETARCMFEETCSCGSLIGSTVEIIDICRKKKDTTWVKTKV